MLLFRLGRQVVRRIMATLSEHGLFLILSLGVFQGSLDLRVET